MGSLTARTDSLPESCRLSHGLQGTRPGQDDHVEEQELVSWAVVSVWFSFTAVDWGLRGRATVTPRPRLTVTHSTVPHTTGARAG